MPPKSSRVSGSASRRVLYVEHHAMDIELTQRYFSESAPHYELEIARSCTEGLTRLERLPACDAVLIDLRMLDMSGLDFVREAQRRGLPLPPFIMISGKGDEAAAITSLKLGAADYVAKRDGYLNQITYTIDRAIAHERLNRVNAQLQAELAERKRAELELQESTRLMDSIVENVPLMIFLKEAQGLRFVVFNRAGEDLLGYDRKDLLGKNDVDIFPPEQAAFFMAKDREVLDGGVLLDIPEEPILTAKKGQRLLHTRKVRIKGADGVTKYLLGISEDITDHKQAEADRVKLEEQLRVSQKMEAIGSLAGGIAHDFNNLLSVILSYTEFVLDSIGEGAPARADLLEVKKAGDRAVSLVRQLLAFSRKQVLEPTVLDLNQIVAELEKMLRRILGEDIDFAQALGRDLGVTFVDPGQIEQVLMNLVVNARDAMPEGGKLTIETANVEFDDTYAASNTTVEPGPYVMLAVSDTGCGMDTETKARIFEPFFTTKDKGKGTGLGLSTVYGIVRQSGGDIHVYSEPGQGTTFKIYLPRKLSTMTAESRTPMAPTHLTGDETILVVEDEEAVCNLAKRILGAAGYTVLTAASGGEALAKCERHEEEIHLVLTDVVMPEMGGRVFAERLAKLRKGIKVLYMSGYTDDAIAHHGTLDPGTKFIGKPFNAADLTRKVREVLDET
jgi:PAS domain S-box-containing protein